MSQPVLGRSWLPLLALAWSCNDPDHPDRLTCPPESTPCGPTDPPPLGGQTPRDAGSTSDAAAPDGGTTVDGRVLVLPDSFEVTQAAPLTDPARVQAEGERGMLVESTAGSGRYELSGVRFGGLVWTTVIPDAFADLMATIQPLDTTGGAALDIVVVRPTALDLALSVLTMPVERLPGVAHAILKFVDVDGAPIEGVTVTPLAGETLAYDTGTSWVDDGLGSGPRGFAVVANVAALAYPGSDHPRSLGGVASGDVLLRFAADAATYQIVVLASGP